MADLGYPHGTIHGIPRIIRIESEDGMSNGVTRRFESTCQALPRTAIQQVPIM